MQIERYDKVSYLRINAGKGNALNPEFLQGLLGKPDEHEASDAHVLVVSGYERFFCAGLDLPTMLTFGRDQLCDFMKLLRRAFVRLFSCPTPTLSAINGHAIAGGCVLSYQADYSVMVEGNFKIGLNETQLGLGLPTEVFETLRARVPATSILPIAYEGKLFTPQEALQRGLVHELVPADKLEARAIEKANEMVASSRVAAAQVKAMQVRDLLAVVEAHADADLDRWLDTFYSDEAQALINAAVEKLKK